MKDTIKQLEEVLRKLKYDHIHAQSTEHSHTLSAEKENTKIVVYVTDQEEVPAGMGVNEKSMPAMHIKPSFPVAEAFAFDIKPNEAVHAGNSDILGVNREKNDTCSVC